jgi:hypothetical protein
MPFGVLPAPDVVDFVVHQHTQIRDLLAEVLNTTGQERRDAFRAVLRLLAVHETAEEEVVHPTVRALEPGAGELVDARLEEERAANELLEQLDDMDTDDPAFMPLFVKLRAAVITHALYEQRYEFNRIRQHVSAPRRAAMRVLVQAAEGAAPTRPHAGVESAAANLILGPPLAIMDRARDAIRRVRERSGPTDASE